MPNPSLIPNPASSLTDARGAVSPEWRDFFLRLATTADSVALRALYEDLATRVAELEQDGSQTFVINGGLSINVVGSPASGAVQISLLGDVQNPAAGSYYGTSLAGVRGFFPLPVSDSAVPYFIPDGQNYTVNNYKQALWKLPITLGVGSSLTILGALEQVT